MTLSCRVVCREQSVSNILSTRSIDERWAVWTITVLLPSGTFEEFDKEVLHMPSRTTACAATHTRERLSRLLKYHDCFSGIIAMHSHSLQRLQRWDTTVYIAVPNLTSWAYRSVWC